MRHFLFFILLVMHLCAQAQQYKTLPSAFLQYVNSKHTKVQPPIEKTMGGNIIVNFFQSDQNIFIGNFGQFITFPLLYNANYTQDSVVNRVWLGLDTIVSANNNFAFSTENMQNTMLDSLTIICGHENNSGANDTLIVSVVKADSNAFPLPAVLYSDTLISNQSFNNSGQFDNFLPLNIPVQLLLPDSAPFAIQIDYFGALTDSFAIQTGFGAFSTCTSTGLNKAEFSNFYPNSFAYWTGYNLILPTQTGGDLYVNCDSQPGFDTITDGVNPIQNLNINVHLSSPHFAVLPFAKQKISIFPIPANRYLLYKLDNVPDKIEIYSIIGKKITTLRHPVKNGTISIAQLKPGIYFLRFIIDSKPYVRKFIKQ